MTVLKGYKNDPRWVPVSKYPEGLGVCEYERGMIVEGEKVASRIFLP